MEVAKNYTVAKLFATYGLLGGAIFLSSFFVFTIVTAGNVTPNASPTSTSYTLTDIYNRLTTNQTATSGNHSFTPAADPNEDGTLYTLTQIYAAIPTITPTSVLSGTSYLGVEGTLTPNGGTASTADIFLSKTAHVTDDWNLDTGTLTMACATDTFDAAGNLIPNAYDGNGDGTNRWCITDSGTATAGNILLNQVAWVDGVAVTGTMPNIGEQTITPSTEDQSISAGYHDGSGYCAGDADLTAGNIQKDVDIFGVTGTLTPNGGTASTADIFLSKTAHVTDDWNLDTGTLTMACATDTFDAAGNLIPNAYDGNGDGTNRWCITDSGTATAGNILLNQVAWVDGAALTGTMPNIGEQTITPSTENQSISAGYHDGSGYCAGDADLIAGNIKSGVNVFGVVGDYTADVTLPACEFAGDSGDVWVKNENCGWTDKCELGTVCSNTCVIGITTYAVETNGFASKCNAVATLFADDCDICYVE